MVIVKIHKLGVGAADWVRSARIATPDTNNAEWGAFQAEEACEVTQDDAEETSESEDTGGRALLNM